MANKIKKKIPNKLLEIRTELNYTQKQFGTILGVGERQINNYETGKSNLQLEYALLISKKWNYSLNWIYGQNTEKRTVDINAKYPDSENINFLVDIRDFFHKKDDSICFSIPDYFWTYIDEVNKIEISTRSEIEKKRAISQLNGKYKDNKKNNLIWKCSLDIDMFHSLLDFGDSTCVYATQNKEDLPEINNEQIEEATKFLNSLFEL